MKARAITRVTVAAACMWGAVVGAMSSGMPTTTVRAQTPAGAPAGEAKQAPAPPQGEAAAAVATSRLGGVWKLNAQLSDPPRQAPEDEGGGPIIGRGRPGGAGGYGGGMGGGRIGGGGTGGRPGVTGVNMDPDDMKRIRALMEELMTLPATLTISERDQTVTLTEPDGRSRTYHTDGRKEKHQAANATVETRTRWEEGGLVVETDLGSGLKAVRTYAAAGNPRQLTVLTKIEGGRFSGQRPPRRAIYDDATPAPQ